MLKRFDNGSYFNFCLYFLELPVTWHYRACWPATCLFSCTPFLQHLHCKLCGAAWFLHYLHSPIQRTPRLLQCSNPQHQNLGSDHRTRATVLAGNKTLPCSLEPAYCFASDRAKKQNGQDVCKDGVETVPEWMESIQMAVVTHTMGVKSKQNENKTICYVPFALLLSFSPCISPGCCPRVFLSVQIIVHLFNYVYVMNNNNPSFTLQIMDYYYSCNKECNI